VFAALGLTLVPEIPVALALEGSARMHVIGTMPTLWNLLKALDPAVFIGAGVWVVARLCRWPRAAWAVSRSSFSLALAWWLVPAMVLFFFSWVTGTSLFVSRYYSLMMPGSALAGTAFAARYIPERCWLVVSAVLGIGALLFLGQWRQITPRNFNYDWRGAAVAINARASDAGTPVVCISPFVEGQSPTWYPDYPLPAFLYAPLAAYPILGRTYPFPFKSSPVAEEYADSVARSALVPSGRFFVYGTARSVVPWRLWFDGRLKARGWTSRSVGDFGEVALVEFDRAHQM
jgi:hypothetical protein